MRNIPIILRKEFQQIRRDKTMLKLMIVMPFVQLIVMAYAATFEVKNLKIFVIDNDKTSTSRLIIDKYLSNNYFIITGYGQSETEGEESMLAGKSDFYIHIPYNFERDLIRENKKSVLLTINGIDATKASLAVSYSAGILQQFNSEIIEKYGAKTNSLSVMSNQKMINILTAYRYNETLNFKHFMVPGILVLLITMIGGFLSGLNLVREKEIGTMEQINVTPIRKYEFLAGKLIPFWIIATLELAFGLFLAWIIFSLPIRGNLLVVFAFSSVYLIAVLGIGLFISTITSTQQQAMFITWFFMVIFILLSGLFTSIENMPQWTQYFTYLNPIRYFIEVIRMVILKGSGFGDILRQFISISVYSIVIFTFALMRYKKVS